MDFQQEVRECIVSSCKNIGGRAPCKEWVDEELLTTRSERDAVMRERVQLELSLFGTSRPRVNKELLDKLEGATAEFCDLGQKERELHWKFRRRPRAAKNDYWRRRGLEVGTP